MGHTYFIYGNDEYNIRKQITQIQNSLQGSVDEIKLDLGEQSIGVLLEEMRTIPFLSEQKLLYVKNIDSINDKSSYYEALIRVIANPMQNILTIFIGDKKTKMDCLFVKDLKKYTTTYGFTNDGKSLEHILDEHLDLYKFQMAVDTKKTLLERVSDAASLLQEVNKLIVYKNETKLITLQDVNLIVPRNLESNVYELVNAVVDGQKQLAVQIFRDMQILNIMPTYLIGLLLTKFQELLDVKVLLDNGYSQELIASVYNVKSARAYYMVKNTRSLSISLLKDKLEYLSKLEADIKMGKMDQTLGLELFLLL